MKKFVFFTFLLISLCTNAYGMGADIDALRDEIEVLKNENKKLADDIKSLSDDTYLLSSDMEEVNKRISNITDFHDGRFEVLEKTLPIRAVLEPSSDKYSLVSCRGGLFAVFCKDIKKYSTGSEVTIMLVNMLGTTISNVHMLISYSNAIFTAGDKDSLAQYLKGKKDLIEEFDGDFLPGKAAYKKIRIAEYPPDQLAILEIRIATEGIKYQK